MLHSGTRRGWETPSSGHSRHQNSGQRNRTSEVPVPHQDRVSDGPGPKGGRSKRGVCDPAVSKSETMSGMRVRPSRSVRERSKCNRERSDRSVQVYCVSASEHAGHCVQWILIGPFPKRSKVRHCVGNGSGPACGSDSQKHYQGNGNSHVRLPWQPQLTTVFSKLENLNISEKR